MRRTQQDGAAAPKPSHKDPVMSQNAAPGTASYAPVASDLPPHGYVITKPVRGSTIPADYTFVLTRDEIYVPIALRKPKGSGPFPLISMGRGNGRGGLPHVEAQVERLAAMQDRMIERGYALAYVSYRNISRRSKLNVEALSKFKRQ